MSNSNGYDGRPLNPAEIEAIMAEARTERSKAFWSMLVKPLFGTRETLGKNREPSAIRSIGHPHQAA